MGRGGDGEDRQGLVASRHEEDRCVQLPCRPRFAEQGHLSHCCHDNERGPGGEGGRPQQTRRTCASGPAPPTLSPVVVAGELGALVLLSAWPGVWSLLEGSTGISLGFEGMQFRLQGACRMPWPAPLASLTTRACCRVLRLSRTSWGRQVQPGCGRAHRLARTVLSTLCPQHLVT